MTSVREKKEKVKGARGNPLALDVQYVLDLVKTLVGTDLAPAQQLIDALAQRSLLPDA